MIIFPRGHVPPLLNVLHLGFGPDAFIANAGWFANYQATNLFGLKWLCASRDPDKHQQMAENLGVDDECQTHDYGQLLDIVFGDGGNCDAVVCITTQTGYHVDHIVEAVNAGAKFVVVDKPLVRTLDEFRRVQETVDAAGARVFLTYNHQFNAPVHQIRRLVNQKGVKRVQSWFLQGWLDNDLTGLRQFDWRISDPLCGPLDIWSHAENLASFVLGSPMTSVSGVRLGTGGGHGRDGIFTSGSCTATFENGVTGEIRFDQALPGHQDDIGVCVTLGDGTHVMWALELGPDNMWTSKWHDADTSGNLTNWRRHTRGGAGIDGDIVAIFSETPPGHHQGWSSMWRYLFTGAAGEIHRKLGTDFGFESGKEPGALGLKVPGMSEAEQTARFVEAAVQSFGDGGAEVALAAI